MHGRLPIDLTEHDTRPAGSALPEVLICGERGCGPSKSYGKLRDALEGVAVVREVGCQKICDGPVCGVELNGQLTWFEEVRGRDARQSFVDLMNSGESSDTLSRHSVRKRAGKLRN